MIKFLSVPAGFVGFMLACVAVCAQAGKSPVRLLSEVDGRQMERPEAG